MIRPIITHRLLQLTLVACPLLFACSKPAQPSADRTPPPPAPEIAAPVEAPTPAIASPEAHAQRLAELANAIQSDPTKADQVLSSAGLSRTQFEQQLVDIAKDAEQAQAYALARNPVPAVDEP